MQYNLPMAADAEGESPLVVYVCRSRLDSAVWFIYAYADGFAIDLSDFESPGRLRAVQRFAAERYSRGKRVQWQRVDADTYELVFE